MAKPTLPKLLYAYDALEPVIDARTMEIHHTKHHQTYVDKLNAALEKHPKLFEMPVEDMLADLGSIPEDIRMAVRNHGGGHVNHSMFWKLMTPHSKERVFTGKIADAVVKEFGSWDMFKEKFNEAALNRFGSGWAWLVLHGKKLEVCNTANQDSPLSEGKLPLLGLDVWEHAYYLKHASNRKAYVEGWWNVVNWKYVNALFENA